MPLYDIGLLGGFHLSAPDGAFTMLGSSRAEKLLAFLLLHLGLPKRRQQVAALFWPDSTDSQSQTNLRRELHRLRGLLPRADELLTINDTTLGLRGDLVSLDVTSFEADLDEAARALDPVKRLGHLESADRHYQGELLPGFYEEWVEVERDRLRQRHVGALAALVRELETKRDYDSALGQAGRLVRLEPLLESACEALMRLHALNGDRASAMNAYQEFALRLEVEYGAEPGPELREAFERYGSQAAAPRTGVPKATERAPLIGREAQWQQLLACWQHAAGGSARVVAILGEAGIGKTRLAEELGELVARQGYVRSDAHCFRAEGRLAFSPVAEWLRHPAVTESVLKLEPTWLREVGRVLPELLVEEPSPMAVQQGSESWRRRKLFEALSRAVAAGPQPLLLLLDDAQWCDPETLEWLHYLLRADRSARLLVVLTVRSEERNDNRPLADLLLELRRLELLDEVVVAPLQQDAAAELASQVLGRALEESESSHLFETSEGHPLFVVEMARAGLTAAWEDGAPAVEARRLPPKVHAVISSRLSQLSKPARELAKVAATVGRAFSFQVLAQASDQSEETLVAALDELWQRQIVREHGSGEYDFSHDRIREVAYEELGPAPRSLLHRRVAEALERLQDDGFDVASVRIAAHYEHSGKIARAIHFYEAGARAARDVSGSSEAVRLLRHALGLLSMLPPSRERDRIELSLQYALSAPLNVTLGYASPQLTASLQRVRTLGERLGQDEAVVASLVGLFATNFVQGDSRKALEVAREAVALAAKEPRLLPESHFALGGSLFSLAHFEEALASFDLSRTVDEPAGSNSLVFGADLAVFRDCYQAHCLWHVGCSLQSLASLDRAMTRAEALGDPYNVALANAYAALTRQFLGDAAEAGAHADVTLELCNRYGYSYYGSWGLIIRGWTFTVAGDPESGLAEIDRGLAELKAVGAAARRPYYLSLRAQALAALGRGEEAEREIESALELSLRYQESWWVAELLRLQGELSLGARPNDAEGPERLFRRAIEVARAQGSRALELRSAVALTRLLLAGEGAEEALELVARCSDAVAEGGHTKDLRAAAALLERMG